ncbi:MAG: chromate transporter [Thermotogota bacterium]
MFKLFFIFFRISALTLGGGYAMVPVMMKNLSASNLLTKEQFEKILVLAQSLPGPIAFNLAWLSGKQIYGLKGSIISSVAVLTPPFFSIVLISSILKQYSENPYVSGFIKGAYASLIGMIAGLLIQIIKGVKFRLYNFIVIIIAIVSITLFSDFTIIVFFLSVLFFYLTNKGFDKNV